MSSQHDFEFQLGRNQALKGRGWRGLAALGLLLTACVLATAWAAPFVSISRSLIAWLLS